MPDNNNLNMTSSSKTSFHIKLTPMRLLKRRKKNKSSRKRRKVRFEMEYKSIVSLNITKTITLYIFTMKPYVKYSLYINYS